MTWFSGLEGARGWLAWTVVIAHIAIQTGLAARYPVLLNLELLGDVAVRVFVILSGFVIYHLIVEKREPYAAYIVRRFMRIYPVYIICLIAGVVVTLATMAVVLPPDWRPLPFIERTIRQMHAAPGELFYANIAAHIPLAHGAIPNNVLYESQFFFLGPAWSLSLEWQFYLVAPLVAFLISRKWGAVALAVAVMAFALAYKRGMFGEFILPSFLPGAAYLFAIGIISRIVLPKLVGLYDFSLAAVLVVAGLVLVDNKDNLHLAIWAVIFCYIASEGRTKGLVMNALPRALDSPQARWFGQRSYPTYLVHMPIIQALILLAGWLGMSYWGMVVTVSAASIVLTVIASDVLHRFAEKPGIRAGARIAATLAKPKGGAAPVHAQAAIFL